MIMKKNKTLLMLFTPDMSFLAGILCYVLKVKTTVDGVTTCKNISHASARKVVLTVFIFRESSKNWYCTVTEGGEEYTYTKNRNHNKQLYAIYWNIIIIIIIYWDAKNKYFFQKSIKLTDHAPIECLFRRD